MLTPQLSGDELLDDIAAAGRDDAALHLWWLGQSGFLLQWAGRRLLVDPYLSDSLTKKYAATDKPHVRMTAIPIEPGRLTGIDVVTSSHVHTDHFDAETLLPLLAANPSAPLVLPQASLAAADERLGLDHARYRPIDVDQTVGTADWKVTALPSAHEQVEYDAAGHCRWLGYLVQLGPWNIYHSGDTILYEGLTERLRHWRIDVAILPINGRGPERRVAGNLWGREAAELARQIDARLAIPCHYEMFTFNTAPPDEFAATAAALRQPILIPKCGQRLTIPAGPK